MKIPCDLKSKGNKGISDYFEQLCVSALACSNLITLEAGPDICDSCSLPPANYMKRTLKEKSPPVISPKRKSITELETATSTTPSESPPVPSSSTGIFVKFFTWEFILTYFLFKEIHQHPYQHQLDNKVQHPRIHNNQNYPQMNGT